MKVLICDDTAFMRSTIIHQLLKCGSSFEIFEAEDGQDAVNKSRKLRPDLIFMDINMPILDGIQATKLIRQDVDSKIIICSCLGNKNMIVSAILAGANDYIIKPIDCKRLERAIDAVWGL